MSDDDTTSLSYWLNWRFLLCVALVLVAVVLASVLIWNYEGFNKSKRKRRENQQAVAGSLCGDVAWMTCLKVIHPAWLLCFRLIAFAVLLAILVVNIVIDGGKIFYYYTQWTFALVTIYFGLGSAFSIYGCCQYHNRFDGYRADTGNLDSEQGSYACPTIGENTYMSSSLDPYEESRDLKTAGAGIYIFQITYQMCAGAVVLTDSVFWLVLYPFVTPDNYKLNFMIVTMHSLNALLLIGDTILNRLSFPLFRMAYFILWTVIFVLFQWIIHACVSIWWPYPFLDLSSPYAPLWYV